MMTALILISSMAIAQPGEHKQKAMPSPEIQAKKMTLALDLSDKQEKEVLELFTEQQASVEKSKLTREERKELTADQKEALVIARLDQRIEMKRELKNILTDEQFQQWEKAMVKRAQNKMKKRRNKDQ